MASRALQLSRLLRDAAPTGALVAFDRDGQRGPDELAERVAALTAALEKAGAQRWLVFSEDSFAAAVSLLALAQTGGVGVLAPNRQPETLRRLAAEARGALLDPGLDEPALAGLPVLAPLGQPPAPVPRWAELERDATLAEFRTSGSTGEGKRVPKRLRHLEDEVATLESVLGPRLSAATHFFATVSHQHIYGLLFRVLWPLLARRPFQGDTLLHPQELLPRMLACGDCALVTTPVHLRRMAATGELRSLRDACRAVFSSGGPLDAETAERVAADLGRAPVEILGSTETGGVALRQRSEDGEAWSPLPGVQVECEPGDERIVVSSPFVSTGELLGDGRQRFVMGDRVELEPSGRFRLLGRVDRIVKVGEKRLSLPAMERDLEAHPEVAEVALLTLPHAGESRVHAVVSLTTAGRERLRREGRRTLAATLTDHLAARWDRVLLPRLWRYVDALPRDAQGKLPVSRLAALFAIPRRDPIVTDERRDGDRIERGLTVPDDLAHLEGHFDAQPMVPGVVQLGWALDAAQELLGRRPRVLGIEALKFPQPLLPGQACRLDVSVSAERDRLRFHLGDGERVFASGRCRLAAPKGEAS
jgi:acyl-coenzyme A synthetase/AMP-(fatty) acid ligase